MGEDKKKSQAYCFNLLVTGSFKGLLAPIAVIILVFWSILVNLTFTISLFYEQNNASFAYLILNQTAVFLGLTTLTSFIVATFSDPGILVPGSLDQNSFEAFCRGMDLSNPQTLAIAQKEEIYTRSQFYTRRNCDTCRQTKPPKASHCSTCGHCIAGFDHHCYALNNCVGQRNFRVFVLFLVSSLAYGLVLVPLCSLELTKTLTESSLYLFGTILFGINMYYTGTPFRVKWIKSSNMRMTLMAINTLISLAVTIGVWKTENIETKRINVTIEYYTALLYLKFIHKMVRQYVCLAARGFTFKERLARKRTSKESCRQDEVCNKPIQINEAINELTYLFFDKKLLKSHFPKIVKPKQTVSNQHSDQKLKPN